MDDVAVRLRLINELSRPIQAARQDVRETTAEAHRMRTAFGSLDRTLVSHTRNVGSYSASLRGLAVGAGGYGLARFAYNATTSLETAQVGFEGLLDSGERAQALLEELAAFDQRSPFRFSQLTQIAQGLLAVGYSADEIIPTMTGIGEAVGALGGRTEDVQRIAYALGQIRGSTQPLAEDLRQLTEARVNPYAILADQLDLSVQQIRERMARGDLGITGQQAADMLVKGMEERFRGGMEAQSKTLSGVISTFTGNAERSFAASIEPILPELTASVVTAGEQVGPALAALAPAISAVGSGLGLVAEHPEVVYILGGLTIANRLVSPMAGLAQSVGILGGGFANIMRNRGAVGVLGGLGGFAGPLGGATLRHPVPVIVVNQGGLPGGGGGKTPPVVAAAGKGAVSLWHGLKGGGRWLGAGAAGLALGGVTFGSQFGSTWEDEGVNASNWDEPQSRPKDGWRGLVLGEREAIRVDVTNNVKGYSAADARELATLLGVANEETIRKFARDRRERGARNVMP